jgi:hypothetical protein
LVNDMPSTAPAKPALIGTSEASATMICKHRRSFIDFVPLVSAFERISAMEATERFGRWPPAKARGDVARYPSGINRG